MQSAPKKTSFASRLLRAVLSLVAVAGIGTAAYLWGPHLYDVYTASQYTPTTQIASVTQRIDLTDQGKTLFYASKPAIEDGTQFNQDCQSVERTAAMLGCYYKQKIFLFNVQNTELDGAVEVTAAHEMLHAAYDRLNIFERQRVDALIAQEYDVIKDDADIKSLMKYYSQAEPGSETNELHSIIGTTIVSLPTELETYYGQYFSDRQAIVAMNTKYNAVFKDVQSRAEELSAWLDAEGVSLKADLAQYDADRRQLEADITTFNDQVNSGEITSRTEYNSTRLALVARVDDLNARQTTINTRVTTYNSKIEELQKLSVKVDELNSSINGISTPSVGL